MITYSTMQDKYQRLQDVCNKLIEKWWKPRNYWYTRVESKYPFWRELRENEEQVQTVSTHDLFSKDSWLMDAVEWKEIPKAFQPHTYIDEENRKWVYRAHHYAAMSQMTAEEKIQYFLDNILL